jgi:hypothetical protein
MELRLELAPARWRSGGEEEGQGRHGGERGMGAWRCYMWLSGAVLVRRRLKMIMTYGSHTISDGRREKGEWMEEREGQLGHFTCFADLDPS